MQPSTWNDERITAYVMGELSPSETAQIKADMRTNTDLATAVDEARMVTKQLTAMFAAESPMLLDDIKRKEILGAPIAISTPPMAVPETASRGAARRYFALAASVLLLGTVATAFYQRDNGNRDGAAQVAMATKPMSELEAINQPIVSETAKIAAPTKDDMSGSLELEPFGGPASGAQAPVAQAPRHNVKSVADLSESLESEMPTAPMAGGPTNAGNALQPAAIAPVKTLSDLAADVSVDMLADNGRGGTLRDVETRRLKQKITSRDDLAKQVSKEGLSSNLTVPPTPSAKPAEMKNEAFSLDFEEQRGLGTARPQSGDSLQVSEFSMAMGDEIADEAKSAMAFGFGGGRPLSSSAAPGVESFEFEHLGQGAGLGGDRFERIDENDFKRVNEEPLSTFSIDVDTASYSKVRQFILQSGALPPAGAVRIEELVNYFDYGYEPPAPGDEHPFASRVEVAACPWKPEHRLARIAIKGKVIENAARPISNLVFLVDTSGSMEERNKLPLVKQGLQKLVSQLSERDRVAIVVYAGSAGLVLDSTPANDRSTILRKINQMQSGGSTNGGQGIRLAYQVARDHFIKDGVNRVILCSDGDFNVGTTSDDELVGLIESESKGGIDLTVLGFGTGNHNDSMMEKISGRGNGNYAFIDSAAEADRVLVQQISGTLVTIARDVKIQVEFNPSQVAAYRLIGYENRKLANEDFKDDTKDAGEIGAGHTVTALYELIPASGDVAALAPAIDELRYQKEATLLEPSKSGELMTVKLRYKKPDSDTSIPVSFPATDGKQAFADATEDFRFATAVAGFGMLLRSSEHVGNWTLSNVQQVAEGSKGNDPHGLRREFVEIVRQAGQLRGSEQ